MPGYLGNWRLGAWRPGEPGNLGFWGPGEAGVSKPTATNCSRLKGPNLPHTYAHIRVFAYIYIYIYIYIYVYIYIYIYDICVYLTGYAHCRRPLSRCRNIGCAGGLGDGLWAECLLIFLEIAEEILSKTSFLAPRGYPETAQSRPLATLWMMFLRRSIFR